LALLLAFSALGAAAMPILAGLHDSDHVKPNDSSQSGGCWPAEDQIVLLRAALFDPDEALAAWREWRQTHTLEEADYPSIEILPLIYRNLAGSGLADPDLSTLRGAYRSTWVRNQVIFDHGASALRALAESEIPTLVLKGFALALIHYRDAGVRTMDDIDVLVPWRDADRALEALARIGIEPGTPGERRRTAHAEHLHDRSGRPLDLHWFSLPTSSPDDSFWEQSVELSVHGVPTRALCPAHQLLHVLVNGAQWGVIPSNRWIADAVTVERSAGIDWEELVAEAARRRLTVTVAAALSYLREAIRFPVPVLALARLQAAPKGRLEWRVHRALTLPAGAGSRFVVELDQLQRRERIDPSLTLGEYLTDHFGVDARRELVGPVARKTAQIATIRIAGRVRPSLVRACPNCADISVSRSGTCRSCGAPSAAP
jgi:hypothetical protein